MGVVWQADDERLRRAVAVKQLLPQPGEDPARAEEARHRAMREGRIAARLQHPNAIAVHDVVEDHGLPVLVMEYLPSRSLADLLTERGALDPAVVADIGTQVASALAAAHAAGIVHRDIKPGNVLIDDDGVAKIADFGISHATDDVSVTRSGLVAGTPAYLAPETARGSPPTPASDVFSLGATLYAAVEGVPPFGVEDENSLALLHRVAEGTVPPPRRAGPLEPVLLGMLRPDPAERLGAAQVRDAARAVAAGRPVPDALARAAGDWHTQPLAAVPAAGPAGTRLDAVPARAARPRRGRLFAVVGGVLVALLAGVLLLTQLNSGEQSAARQPQASGTRPVAAAELERAVAEYYALLPDRPGAAWARLGPGLRAEGRQEYESRWAKVSELDVVSQPRETGERTVHVGTELVLDDGAMVTEFHQLGLITDGDALLIDSDTLLHSESTAPPPPEDKDDSNDSSDKNDSNDKNNKNNKNNKEDKGKEDEKGEKGEKGEDRKGEADEKGERDKKGERN